MEQNGYTIDELKTASLEYFHGDELASNVWVNKYALKTNGKYAELSPKDMIERMAKEIHRMELTFPNPLSYQQIFDTLNNFKHFVFGGSILFGLGNNHQVSSLGNCFFIDNNADSYGAIFNLDENMAQLMKRRGGVGVTIENLRPSGSKVNNSAQSSTGATSFMDRYSNTTREVAQDGRRGALMISMHINHPDVKDFIIKKDDRTKVTGANISVKITDDFMKAVDADGDYILRWPIVEKQPVIQEQLVYNKLYKRDDGSYIMKVKAREVWNLIIKQAHKNAEPGVLFWDQIIRESPADCYADEGMVTKGTNPCIVGDTLIAVADGRNAVSIKQLVEEGKDVPVYSTNNITGKTEIKWARNPRLTKQQTEVWKLTLDDDSVLIATPDHKILTSSLEYKQLHNLIKGESLVPFYSFLSNKQYRQISRTGAKMIGGNFRNRRQYGLIYEFFYKQINSKTHCIHHNDFNSKNDDISNLQEMLIEEHKILHTKLMLGNLNPYYKMTNKWKHDFASHPGEKNGKYISVSNMQILEAGKKLFAEKGILLRNDWRKYAKENGFPQKIENSFRFENFENFRNQVVNNHKVKSVEFYGYEDVYNITVDDNNNYHVITDFSDPLYITSSGICIKNCGEVPLSPFDSCRLGSINLNNMVLNPYTKEAIVDWNTLERVSKYAQRFMDDIVSLEEEKILTIIAKITSDPEPMELKQVEFNLWTKVLEVLRKGRRTGVGMFGLGDMLAKLGLKYDCDEASELKAKVAQTIAVNCYKETVNLAEERGCFPIWNADKEAQNPFIIRVISGNFTTKEYKKYLKVGRRNIALLSIAPTGTMALQAQTTSGIEPVFKCFYYRKRKVNPGDKDQTRPITKDENGDWWEQYAVFHYEFEQWAKLNKIDIYSLNEKQLDKLVAESPWAGSESHTVNPIEKVKSQGIIQKWVDHSISITHNLPENVTLEDVNKIYFEAWKSGCKGCTIYREGSRAGVLTTKKDEDDFSEVNAPKRPKEIPADYYVATANGIKYAVIVGLYKGKPYEIFAFENPPMDKNTKGRTVKIKKGHYKFINGEFEIDNVQLAEDRIQQRTLTLTASMLLRGRAPIQHVIKVIRKIDDNISSFSSVVTRILGKYIVESLDEKCPNCGGNLVREEGCVHCQSCEYSKC